MADAYTQVSSVSFAGTQAYEALAYFSLRPELHFDQIADVKPSSQTHSGATVQFMIYDELAEATTALTETVDPDAVAISDSNILVTLVEQGNAALTTAKARATDMVDLDAGVADLIGYNAGVSIDTIARNVLSGGTNVAFGSGAANAAAVDATKVLTANDIAIAVAKLRTANARPVMGSLYAGHFHPHQMLDLRKETGAAGWTEVANQNEGGARRWSAVTGAFNGVMCIETPRVRIDADAGSGNVDLYDSVITGKQALAKAHAMKDGYGELPSIVIGPQVDKLRRFNPIGWKWLGGYSIFRQNSIQRVETAASIGAN